MANEITIYETVNNIGQAINAMSKFVLSGRHLRKKELIVLEEELRLLKESCQMKATGELIRLAADEMDKTIKHYESKGFPDYMQGWVLDTLKIQADSLSGILRDYRH